jgi:hypothetical protein
VQPVNKLRCHGFWLRDAAIMTQALDPPACTGRRARTLRSSASGSAPAASSSHAWASSTATAKHAGRSPNTSCAPATRRSRGAGCRAWAGQASGWREARLADPLELVPEPDPRENEPFAGHLAGDDFWDVAGLAAAVDAARMLGDSERAARWSLQLEALRAVVRRRVGEAAARNGGAIAPVLDRAGGRDWGNLRAAGRNRSSTRRRQS